MSDSIQYWLNRNRPPRVKITYDVETGGAIKQTELPFVVGVIADLAGTRPDKADKKMKERKFVMIDQDNFNEVMVKVNPQVKVSVPNFLVDPEGEDDDRGTLPFAMEFETFEDFEPVSIINKAMSPDDLEKYKEDMAAYEASDGEGEAPERPKGPLAELLEARRRLNDLVSKLDGNDELEELLTQVAESTEDQEKLASLIADASGGSDAGGDGGGDAPAAEAPAEE